jgi:hypothetical protein
MPWWFWPLAVMWTVPVIGCVWLVVAVLVGDWRGDRAVARMERRSEERARELLGSRNGDGGARVPRVRGYRGLS